jgi:hypothetical protein
MRRNKLSSQDTAHPAMQYLRFKKIVEIDRVRNVWHLPEKGLSLSNIKKG